jgi:2-epi-5-epi-valiolone synthase
MPVTTTERGWKASVTRPVDWTAEVLPGLLDATPDQVPDLFGDLTVSPRRLVVVDSNVYRLYGHRILALLDRYEVVHSHPVVVAGGEASKNRATCDLITSGMEGFGVERFSEPVLVWGGGVLHDVAGFAASEYRRGVPYRMFATTLLASVDAGFALKVALSHGYKNRVGAYHPAEAMFTDPALFARDRSHIIEGAAEILKWALAAPDPAVFDYFERHGPDAVANGFAADDPHALAIIRTTIEGMMRELEANPYEAVSQRRSYIGHGMSPGLEPTVTHGQAVILDILLTLMIATGRAVISETLRDRIVRVIRATGLPLWHDVLEHGPGPIMRALDDTARHRHGLQSIPVMDGELGRITYMQDITAAELGAALYDLNRTATAI